MSDVTSPDRSFRGAVLSVEDLYSLPEGAVLWKPQLGGWTLFIKDAGHWRVVDAYNRAGRGERWSPEAVGALSPGYVIHQAPDIGYYTLPHANNDAQEG